MSQAPWEFLKLIAAASTARDVFTLGAGFTTGDINLLPGPVRAAAVTAENVDVDTSALNSSGDIINGQVGDGDSGGRCTSRAAVLIILLNDNTVFGNSRQSDVLVGDARDGTSRVIDSLDTYTWK